MASSSIQTTDTSDGILTMESTRHGMLTMEVNGKLFPSSDPGQQFSFNADIIKDVPNIKLREDDIIICAYPKSGTHWLYGIVHMLLRGVTNVRDVPRLEHCMFELNRSADLEKHSVPRVCATHLLFEDLPTDVALKKPKLIYLTRNPKDVMVSFYTFQKRLNRVFVEFSGEFKDYIQFFVEGKIPFGSWFDHVLGWEDIISNTQELQIFPLNYEHLKKDPAKEITNLSNFLRLNRDDDFIKEVTYVCSFSKMKERLGDMDISSTDSKPIFYRKGEIGDWKNWFTVAQSEWFDQIYKEKMAKHKFQFRFE